MNGPKFEVLYEFKSSNGKDCRIVTEDKIKPGMMRGESWNEKDQEWKQWLQSSEAGEILSRVNENKALKEERDQLKAERDALRAEPQPS